MMFYLFVLKETTIFFGQIFALNKYQIATYLSASHAELYKLLHATNIITTFFHRMPKVGLKK
jgi:hypothetical protein